MRIRDLLRLNRVSLGRECPECGERASHEDNGARGSERAYCCTCCGTQWDVEFYRAKLEAELDGRSLAEVCS